MPKDLYRIISNDYRFVKYYLMGPEELTNHDKIVVASDESAS
jgi:hypothetical protein